MFARKICVRARSILEKYARKCSSSIFEHTTKHLLVVFSVVFRSYFLISCSFFEFTSEDIWLLSQILAKKFQKMFFKIILTKIFQKYNVRVLEARKFNVRRCSSSKILENLCSRSLDTRKIDVRCNTIL